METRSENHLSAATYTVYMSDGRIIPKTFTNRSGSYKQVTGVWEDSFLPGNLRLNPCEIQRYSITCDEGYVLCTPDMYLRPAYHCSGQIGANVVSIAVDKGTWSNSRANAALVIARKRTHNVTADVGLMMAEGVETLRMLANPLVGLRSLATRLYNGAKLRKKSIPAVKDLANQWLEYRYGMLPLMSDCESIINAVYDCVDRSRNQLERRKGRNITPVDSVITNLGWWSLGTPATAEIEWLRTSKVTEEYTATQFFTRHGKLSNHRYGGGINSLPNFLWELVPYSFVVDWFIGIGDWLQAITPAANVTLKPYCISRLRRKVEEYSPLRIRERNYSGRHIGMNINTVQFVSEYYERKVFLDPNQPVYPVTGFESSFRRVADGLSLILQQIPSSLKSRRKQNGY